MSLILDALKKMEQERAARRKGTPDIRPEIVRTRQAAPRKGVGLYMMAGGVTIAAVAAFLVIVFHHPTKDMENAVPSGRLSVPSPSATPTLAPPVDATAKVAEPPRPEQHLSSPAPERQPQGSDESAALPDPASTNLTVTGIAWQEEKYARRAVVNGTLLGEGSVIAGARIVEIKEDRVRFSIGGRTMEVLLSSALQNIH